MASSSKFTNKHYLSKAEIRETINEKMTAPCHPYTKYRYPNKIAYEPIKEETYAPIVEEDEESFGDFQPHVFIIGGKCDEVDHVMIGHWQGAVSQQTIIDDSGSVNVFDSPYTEEFGDAAIQKCNQFKAYNQAHPNKQIGYYFGYDYLQRLRCPINKQVKYVDPEEGVEIARNLKAQGYTHLGIYDADDATMCTSYISIGHFTVETTIDGANQLGLFSVDDENGIRELLTKIEKAHSGMLTFCDPDNNKIFKEIPDDIYFEHDINTPYVEDAYTLYRRFGEHFKYNADPEKVQKWVYKGYTGWEFEEEPTKYVDGSDKLQVFTGDLKLTIEQVMRIWRAAYYDYQEYLPKYMHVFNYEYVPRTVTIHTREKEIVEKTEIEKKTVMVTKKVGSHTIYGEPEWVWDKKSIKAINVTNSDYLDPNQGSKKIMEYIPAVDYTGPFTVTMGTSHWYGFNICEVDIGMDMNKVDIDFTGNPDTDYKYSTGWYYNPAYISKTNTTNGYHYNIDASTPAGAISHIWGSQPPAFNEYAIHDDTPMSITLNNVTFSKGKKYFIYTKECPGGGTEADKFVYSFCLSNDIEDEDEMDVNIPVLYKRQQRPEKTVDDYADVEQEIELPKKYYEFEEVDKPKQITVELVEHVYLEYYPEEDRQKYFQEIEDTFQEIRQRLKEKKYKYGEHFVGSQYQSPSSLKLEDKYSIVMTVHDFLIENNTYGGTDPINYSLYAAMSHGKYTCDSLAYSLAFKHCCNRFGIITQIMSGLNFFDYETKEEVNAGIWWHWNRICYLDNKIKERIFYHRYGIIHPGEKNCAEVLIDCIKKYDEEHLNNYFSRGAQEEYARLYYGDPSVKENIKSRKFIESHVQFDKNQWAEMDLVYDTKLPFQPAGKNIPKAEFFNTKHHRFKEVEGGRRLVLKYLSTNYRVSECYANFVGQDDHYDQYCSTYTGRTGGTILDENGNVVH